MQKTQTDEHSSGDIYSTEFFRAVDTVSILTCTANRFLEIRLNLEPNRCCNALGLLWYGSYVQTVMYR